MATFHESFPTKLWIPDDAPLWRYCNFSKFASMLANKQLFMTRADRFEDIFEGAISREELPRQVALHERDFTMNPKPWDSKRREELFRKWFADGPPKTYLSCWYSGETECDAMWKVYGETRDSVALRSTIGRMKTVLPADVFLLPVQYVDLAKARLPSKHQRIWQFAFKRREFAYESELRCIKQDWSDERPSDGYKIGIDVASLVTEVVTSPRAPGWFVETVRAVVRNFGLYVDVRPSAMIGEPWRLT